MHCTHTMGVDGAPTFFHPSLWFRILLPKESSARTCLSSILVNFVSVNAFFYTIRLPNDVHHACYHVALRQTESLFFILPRPTIYLRFSPGSPGLRETKPSSLEIPDPAHNFLFACSFTGESFVFVASQNRSWTVTCLACFVQFSLSKIFSVKHKERDNAF